MFNFSNRLYKQLFGTYILIKDPGFFNLEGEIMNPHPYPLQIDNSFHSIIREIIVMHGDTVVEKISDYHKKMALYFDQNLNIEERKFRHEDEGFAYDEFGSNSAVIPSYAVKAKNWPLDIDTNEMAEDLADGKQWFDEVLSGNDYLIKEYDTLVNTYIGQAGVFPPKNDSTKISLNSEHLDYRRIVMELCNRYNIDSFYANVIVEKIFSNENDAYTKPYTKGRQALSAIFGCKTICYNDNLLNKNFGEVKTGRLALTGTETFKNLRNSVKFRLPLMLKTIGANSVKNGDLIPMSLYPNGLRIIIYFNQEAFAVHFNYDINMVEGGALESIFGFTRVYFESVNKVEGFATYYSMKNTVITSVEYLLPKGVESSSMLSIKRNEFKDIKTEIYPLRTAIGVYYFPSTLSANLSEPVSKVKAIKSYFSCGNGYNPYKRNNDRFNLGVKLFYWVLGNEQYPPAGMVECNSFNTIGNNWFN
jgi:hypothetical protein